MVDETRLRALLDRIGDELTQLHRLSELDPKHLLADGDRVAAVKYRFIVAVEAAIDSCRHIVASEGLRAPTDFADAFAALGEGGFLPADLVPALQDMARFRNLLVHGYARVDDARVVEVLRTRLGDLEAFRRSVAARVGNA
jgi:uncharacterized protein YutE (UPF0331/DUF86 family)